MSKKYCVWTGTIMKQGVSFYMLILYFRYFGDSDFFDLEILKKCIDIAVEVGEV